ncbi:T9SS type A sorting domain-containing protein [Winogradskyella algicola]|uniref:T9SS type A sorting domain-containing protein n=1 Tax=Winogradskyella algicola TaxID=2575815 RepID=UPI0011099A77|nr:T9SS type A sorting domain-containing protein [Winogradskyella algicola]
MKTTYGFQMLVTSLLCTVFSYFGYGNTTFEFKKETLIFNSFPTTLSGFTYEANTGPSANQTFSINDGLLLTRPYTVTAPSGYEVSTSASSGFSNTIVIPGNIIDLGDVTVYVRLSSGLATGIYTGNLNITAPDTTVLSVFYPGVNEIISLSGNVTRVITSWNGSTWSNGTPNIESITTINGDYDTSVNGNFSTWSLTVGTGQNLVIGDNSYIEVEQDAVINGTLQVASSGSFVQNDDTGTFTVNSGGEAYLSKTTSVLKNWYDYTYWSSPVSGSTANQIFPSSNSSYRYWFNAQNYLDILQETNNGNTYVAGHDDVDDNGDDWTTLNDSDILIPGVGYAITNAASGFVTGNTYQYMFSGPFNTGVINTSIYYNGNNGDNDWNFIGNPYPSAIDVDLFFAENNTVVGDAIYLWSHASPASNSNNGNEILNFSADDYAIINAGSGEVAGGSTIIPSRYIPSCQGFFIQGKVNGNVVFNNAMRMKDGTSNSQFFRQNNNTTPNKLWLNLTSDNGVFSQILVAYVNGATDNNDGLAYDSPRFLSSGTAAILYTTIENELDKKYAIQGKSISSINTQEVIPLGFYTSISDATIYSFSIPKKQGSFINNQPIFIKDNLLNSTHNLLESDYTFTSSTGDFTERFEIVFNAETLSNNDNSVNDYGLSIIPMNTKDVKVNISGKSLIENIKLYSTEGKLFYNNTLGAQSTIINLRNYSSGIYIAMVELDNGVVVKRKLIL